MSSAASLAWSGLLLLGIQGCLSPLDAETVDHRRQSIIEGESSGADEDGVLMLRAVLEDEREVVCTASLIAPNLLVTARHCVSYLTEGLFTCTLEGELQSADEGAGQLGLHLPAEWLEVYGRELPRDEPLARGQQVLSTLSDNICTNDLAFVVLDRELELPLLPLRIGRPASFGEATAMVGYGLEAGQVGIDHLTQPRMRRGGLTIAGVGPDSLEDGVTTVAPRMLVVDGPSGCIGDSGGPLIAEATGAILGVFSLQQGGSCTAKNVRQHLVHLPPFERLLADAFAAAGAEPVLEATSGGGADNTGAGAAGEAAAAEAGRNGEGGQGATPPPDEPDDSGCSTSGTPAHARWSWLLGLALLGRRLSAGRRAGPRLSQRAAAP